MPKENHSSIPKEIKQFLVVFNGNSIFSMNLEPENDQDSPNDLLSGFVSAIEAFSTSFYDKTQDQSSVGFGNRTIIINKDVTGIVGALVTEKLGEKQINIISQKLKSILQLFSLKYASIILGSSNYDSSVFEDFKPFVIGSLFESNISRTSIPKPNNVEEYPTSMTGDCWRVFMQIDGVRNIEQIIGKLGPFDEFFSLFGFLKKLNIIKA
ncbi:MAG: hypothetical protein ACW981_05450 [Candidatus Hodarchaeales archaeon]|jgi:hypothetical protein